MRPHRDRYRALEAAAKAESVSLMGLRLRVRGSGFTVENINLHYP